MKKNNNNALIAILLILCILLTGYIVYDKVFDNKLKCIEEAENQNTVVENTKIPNDIYRTYYNSVPTGEYFTLNSDGTAVVVFSTCSDGLFAPKTISYKLSVINDEIVLELDINNNNMFEHKYTFFKNTNEYKFKPNTLGCTDEENSSYFST